MWGVQRTDHFDRRIKRFDKKKKLQLSAVLNNLKIFQESLHAGKPPKPFVYGFLHSEPMGVIAIDQTGGRKVAATRLYVYPDVKEQTLYLLTLGDKDTQGDDIEDCKRFVREIERLKQQGDAEWEADDGDEDDEAAGEDEEG